ncbi:NAD-dependent epimerase/dehydratase family protein [Cognatiluteimonas profundi]|uniref:NAD-dependent epimerase/dehydratase family protein n=1 Tax=Cognatiluteimonas profundi TaxID=2594501 RepID=UPI00131B756A|nr:NAD-dependent epimerase/dehydratase family protein [Lysobacter profundi]
MRRALVFGGSGQIGASLLARLQAAQWSVIGVSRNSQPASAGVQWLRGDLSSVDDLPACVDAIFSCGPLDHFGRWYAESTLDAARVVAFGSTSVDVKASSVDPAERDLALRLAEGERAVFAAAAIRGAGATLLRPTLVYGAGRDQTLTRIANIARRWGRMLLPRDACGLRQPVHVDDLSAAALAACDAVATHGQAYALAGGETLQYREMVARVLAVLQPPAALIEIPAPLFHAAAWSARMLGRTGMGDAVVARLRSDLVFDVAPASRAFGYAPRAFRPTADMFKSP